MFGTFSRFNVILCVIMFLVYHAGWQEGLMGNIDIIKMCEDRRYQKIRAYHIWWAGRIRTYQNQIHTYQMVVW